MRVTQPVAFLGEYYDRSPATNVIEVLHEGIGPHTATVRATYQVPEAIHAIVLHVHMYVRRRSLATTVDEAWCSLQYAPDLVHWVPLFRAYIWENTTTKYDIVQIPCNFVLRPGDSIRIVTGDFSEGGTCDYNARIFVMEFA